MSSGPPESDPNPLAALSPPHWVITDDDHGPYVIIATWTMMCFMVLTVTARLARKVSIRAWGLDDYLISIATVLGLVQCGVLHKAVEHGLGQRFKNLRVDQRDYFNKATYGFEILFITTLTLSKISLMHFVTRLTPSVRLTRACHILIAIIVVWGVGTIFGIAFGCPLPTPWDTTSGTCRKQSPLLYSTGILDLFTDLAITALPIVMMWNVQIPRGQRLTVMAVFLIRAAVCLAEIPRLIYITRHFNSNDPSFSSVDLSIWTQAVTNLSIATACIPCLKPFLASLGSGVLDTRLPSGFESRVDYTLSGSGSQNHTAMGTRNRSNLNFYGSKTNQIRTKIESSGNHGGMGKGEFGLSSNGGGISRSESKTRLTGSDGKGEGEIYRTTEFVMDVDDSPPSSSKKD